MKKRLLLILLPLFLFMACNNASDEKSNTDLTPQENLKKTADYIIDMHFSERSWSNNADTLFLRFRITNKETNRKVSWSNLSKEMFTIKEDGGNPPNKDILIKKITHTQGKEADLISQNALFLFMVDRSKTITEQKMEEMKSAIQRTVENLPDSCAYISFFDKCTSEKKMITKTNFHEFAKEFRVEPEKKCLYQSIIDNLEKFDKDTLIQKKNETNITKYMLVFTDGNVNLTMEELDLIDDGYINKSQNKVQIHAFRYGDEDPFVDGVLNNICAQRQNPELRGKFYPSDDVEGVVASLRGFVDDLSADYELTLLNKNDKIYNGTKLTLQIIINKDNKKAVGEIFYTIGSKEKPIGPGIEAKDTYIAIIFGIIILFIAFFVMQVVIPYFASRAVNFEKKYVRPYEPPATTEGEVYEACAYCQEPLEKGELIVVKCRHKIHWGYPHNCWQENGYKCVEYGQNCKDGIQYHFDKKHPFDLKKSPYYLKWAMSGMISGFFIWIIFKISSEWKLFTGLIDSLLNQFYPKNIEGIAQIPNNVKDTFHLKITGLLLVGILLGFALTFLFSYINDFRRKKGTVMVSIFMRALIGAVVGFATFLIGSILCILLGEDGNVWWLDAIPWVLFGGSIALCLVYKTTIKWQDALIGGLVSGIVSFSILYTTSYFPVEGVMFSFMLCSAGLGISIIARHQLAQKYFLKYKGEKREGEIAIHKWMNESGGSNEVTIGKSNHCIIQMNWDSSDMISDKQVKLYIDPKRRIPVLKSLENGMTYDGREAHKDDHFPLKNGVKFKIGNTVFQYVEK